MSRSASRDEYTALLRAHWELEREHRELSQQPYDKSAYVSHIDRLRQHSERLHAYIKRFRPGADA
jgi:hypothetical protein